MGDVKLAAFLGAWLGTSVVVALFAGSLLALVPAFVIVVRHGRAGRKVGIPFAPFLAAGGVVALFCGEAILDWWLGVATPRAQRRCAESSSLPDPYVAASTVTRPVRRGPPGSSSGVEVPIPLRYGEPCVPVPGRAAPIDLARFERPRSTRVAAAAQAETPAAAIDGALEVLHDELDGAGVCAFVLEHGRLWSVGVRGYAMIPDGLPLDEGVIGRAVRTAEVQLVARCRRRPGLHRDHARRRLRARDPAADRDRASSA